MTRFFVKILHCTVLFGVLQVAAYAQTVEKNISIPQVITGKKGVADTTKDSNKPTDQKDLPEVLFGLFGHKASNKSDSVTTKPEFSVVPAVGYTLVTKLAFVLAGNVAWRTGPQSRISTLVTSVSYTLNKQFIIPIESSIWTKNNKYNFIGDYRFYRYPQSTFGLGSSSNIDDENPMDFTFFRFYETALRHITGNLYGGIGYALDSYTNISEEGTLDGKPSAYNLYGTNRKNLASGLTANFVYDSRDNSINPAKGFYGSLLFRTNQTFLGSSQNWQSLTLDVRKYINFPQGSHNTLALWSYNWLVVGGRPSYLNLPSTGWDQNSATGRGYIQGRFRGAQMVYLESEYRFPITKNGLLGGVIFANAQSLSAQPGTRLQAVQPAIGPGLRVKLNKTSRTNIAIDYGFGRQGSNGLFIDVGEIF
ncbi:BamA/TamA family outer membrane protein [Mucilaginibacter ginkgonis]|uniref:BamA/TamA family outer membrane protein n=1 Tax=Mucilaginibacter ginkgonis TaxID=2682091 RepID=A0A7T7FAI7_9SPHI|nr:BamA/TamA family outer membrane protein [Mucilaginibacter ginkgonis]QQL49802.1 BamA/TamA family outer membrane protein [Mucilaginibacter ginkgonis]